ncbi:response regulator [Thiohalobacter sp. IOR34]|uniref:response regulator n=1 Tax=Thiohalobacter sp. IOR34 TaxID=3057176 RepID=UPI0025AEE655|nr:response regulator [Thiohalobacter sp. IOR34]WJW75983.1 response regulator [Thiohalobacter sp. IOR34]
MHSVTIQDLSISLVEPSAVQAQIISRQLSAAGVSQIQTLGSGSEAIDYCRRHQPDLVISAMYLPDMTGSELLQALRQDEALEALSFMLISSETSFAMLDPVRQAGVVAILPKPFLPEELQRALNTSLEFITLDEQALAEPELEDLSTLVVDDSPMARKYIIRILNALGIHDITSVENGRQAVEMVQSKFFDLVVTDYNMPEMDGEMLTRYIREHSSQSGIPILMVTSEGDSGRLAAVQQAGVSGICDKPFDASTVRQMICNLLD